MLIFFRWCSVFILLFSGTLVAQNRVVVVPLLGDGSSHVHPEIEYISLSAAAFQPTTSGTIDGLVLGSLDEFSYAIFYANLNIPNGATLKSLRATYIDGDAFSDVWVSLIVTSYSENELFNIAGIRSTGLSFGAPFSNGSQTDILPFAGKHPINNRDNGYSLQVLLRNGAALRGVTIGYTTRID